MKENTVCIAMPIRDYTKRIIAAISISGSAEEITEENIEAFKPILKEACDGISDFLGANA